MDEIKKYYEGIKTSYYGDIKYIQETNEHRLWLNTLFSWEDVGGPEKGRGLCERRLITS